MDELQLKRQRKLYNFLIRNGNKYIEQRDVADHLYKYYPYNRNKYFHNCKERMMMTDDIRAINNSSEFEKIIIQGSDGIKIATKKEFNRYMKSQLSTITAMWKRWWVKVNKGKLDKAMKLDIETMSYKTISSFLEEE